MIRFPLSQLNAILEVNYFPQNTDGPTHYCLHTLASDRYRNSQNKNIWIQHGFSREGQLDLKRDERMRAEVPSNILGCFIQSNNVFICFALTNSKC